MNVTSSIEVSGPTGLLDGSYPGDGGPGAPSRPEAQPTSGLHAAAAEPGAAAERLTAVALGGLSLALYALLFWFDEELIELAQSTRRGDKRFFFVPIAVALLFSFVHGAFTGRFWDVLGLKART